MSIRITYTSQNHRDFVDEYETDDLAEALIAQADRGFRLKPLEEGKPYSDNRGPDKWIFAFIVERDDHRFTQEEIVAAFRDIANMEQLRGGERTVRPTTPMRQEQGRS